MFWKKSSLKELLPPPVKASHGEYSMILSAHDDSSRPTETLLDVSLHAIQEARKFELKGPSDRLASSIRYPQIWPGEHYKLLAGFARVLNPQVAIEIGSATGLSALCMKEGLSEGSVLHTFDIVPWTSYPNTVFQSADFQDGSLIQHVADLSVSFELFRPLLSKAGLIFIDATHDGDLERTLLDLITTLEFESRVYLIFDDIRVWTMLKMWRRVKWPKIDLTSFGHWSGTGLVELPPRSERH